MTAQFNDLFRYQQREFVLAGISTGELFRPADFGLFPIPASTACWRGYLALYALLDSHLVLDRLSVNLREPQGPAIQGVIPQPPTQGLRLFNNEYPALAHPIAYTGGLLIAAEFIQELYVHMGFHPAWKYKTVFELTFENGQLTGEHDRSEPMAATRRSMAASGSPNGSPQRPTGKTADDFIRRVFNRTYKQQK